MNLKEETKLAIIAENLEYIKREIIDIKRKMEQNYVTRQEFEPIKKVVYGIISLLLVATVGAILRLILIP